MIRSLLFILFQIPLAALAQDPYHIVYGIEEGLPSEEVYDVYVDADDIVWATTDRGVSRFNGYEFENFSTSDGLAYNTNFKIFSDPSGRLWFLGYDGSISIYEDDAFRTSQYSNSVQTLGENKFLYGLGYDKLGNIYSYHAGLFWSKDKSYVKFQEDGTVEEIEFGDPCDSDSSDNEFCIKSVEFENTSFIYIPKFQKISPSNVRLSDHEGLFICPLTGTDLDKRRDKVQGQLYSYSDDKVTEVLSSDAVFNSISVDNQGNILVCSTAGVFLYRNGNLDSTPERYFIDKQFSDVYQDKNGNYWFSSEKNGLFFVPTFEGKVFDQRGLLSSSEKMVIHDDHLFYYYGTQKVDYIDKEDRAFELSYADGLENPSFTQTGNTGMLISKFDGNYYMESNTSARNIFRLNQVLDNGDLLATSTKLHIRRGEELVFTFFSSQNKELSNSSLRRIVIRDDDIWFSTLRYLYRISDYNYDDLQKIMDKDSLLDVRLNDFEFDSQEHIWLASVGNGLLHKSEKKVTKLNESDGLSSNQINTLHIENDTSLWVGSNNGLDWVQLKQTETGTETEVKSIYNFSTKDGLLSNYINDIIFWNDKLWIASKKGLQNIDLKNAINEAIPSLNINGIQVNDSLLNLSTEIELEHDQNNITFHYEGVCYNKPKGSFYKYKIERKNERANWNYTNNRSAIFQNLDAGVYTFSVSARNKNNEWCPTKEHQFEIEPHFTSTWWFWILCAFLLAGITYYIYYKRLQYLINKNRQEQTLQDAILRTEIAELSTFRNQFNPHFIFNSLNSIQNYIFKKDVRQANSFLSKFSKLIRESLNLSDKKMVSIEKELGFMKAYLELEFLRFPDKFAFEFHNDEDIPTDLYHMPPLLLQPVIENVVKHAFKGKMLGKLDISINPYESDQGVVIIIEDDGTGMIIEDENIQNDDRKSFGMKIVHDRIKLLNIDYPHVKSSFTINNKVNSSGTIAKFVIPKITIEQV